MIYLESLLKWAILFSKHFVEINVWSTLFQNYAWKSKVLLIQIESWYHNIDLTNKKLFSILFHSILMSIKYSKRFSFALLFWFSLSFFKFFFFFPFLFDPLKDRLHPWVKRSAKEKKAKVFSIGKWSEKRKLWTINVRVVAKSN